MWWNTTDPLTQNTVQYSTVGYMFSGVVLGGSAVSKCSQRTVSDLPLSKAKLYFIELNAWTDMHQWWFDTLTTKVFVYFSYWPLLLYLVCVCTVPFEDWLQVEAFGTKATFSPKQNCGMESGETVINKSVKLKVQFSWIENLLDGKS